MADKAGANQPSTLNGLFKEIYADNIVNLVPDGSVLVKRIEFAKSKKELGNQYHQPVSLTHEHGFTFGGSAGSAYALENALQGTYADAVVKGFEMTLRSMLSIGAVSRSVNEGPAAFKSATKVVVENMLRSFTKRLEIEMLYGQSGFAVVDAVNSLVLTIKSEEWAPGIWAGAEGMPIQILSSDLTAQHVATTVTAVDVENKTISVAANTNVVQGDIIFPKSAIVAGVSPTFNEMIGLHKMITNTGDLFGINSTSYNLWKGNSQNVGTGVGASAAKLDFASIEAGIAKAVNKGLVDEDLQILVSATSWSNLLVELAAKRVIDSSYSAKMLEQGTRNLKFHSMNGIIEIIPSIYVKEGYAYGIPMREFMRIGSSDISFEIPGRGEEYFKLLEDYNAFELRATTDQSLFTSKIGLCVLYRYIKN